MSAHCYNYVGGKLTSYGDDIEPHYFPCGPVNSTNPAVQCCAWGDSCLSGGICSYTHSLAGGSGYYAAACTDETLQDEACRSICGGQLRPDVTYIPDRGLWACCRSDENGGNLDCADPTDETFRLDAPEDLPVFFKVPASGFAYTSESIATSTSTMPPTTASTPSSTPTSTMASSTPQPTISAGLSSGAAAGIGVGVAAAVIIVVVLAWLAFRRQKRRRGTTTYGEPQHRSELGHDEIKLAATTPTQSQSEYRQSHVQELGGNQTFSELPG
ncbi:hypothetical protein F5B22DRAFT_592593 [Xylaria bambusicola]|uniref:uncharacterized protein n=1 Tax=Xylaria bambusicola TaxID=326684 RepID=UPI00200888E3|nr:uncharacterized protein F5B22DRAFT_592593 [Xylaria bambusicola]KAI0523949.1 hypothetical protein F5B22DRAFT_592593 [Xylaria bambusicola]